MTALVRLGIRLAGGGGSHDRLRSGLTLLSGVVAGWLLMNLFAIGAAEHSAGLLVYSAQELERFYLVVIAIFTLPVVVLIATTSRLSAGLRDRRLATLRLLGLSPGQTRLVAGVEAATVSGVGTVIGVALFYATRPLVQASGVAGRDWEGHPFTPAPVVIMLILLLAPLTSVLVAIVPAARIAPLARARRAEATSPSPVRVVPIAVGVVMVGWVVRRSDDDNITNPEFFLFFAGVVLVGLGILLCVPVLVRLLAALLLRTSHSPTARIAARRLQSQPAGVARVVSGMLIGLFIVSGAQCVIVAFAQEYQVEEIHQRLDEGPAMFRAYLPPKAADEAATTVASLRQVDGVQHVFAMDYYLSTCQDRAELKCVAAFVGRCADLASLHPVPGCDDRQVAWLGGPPTFWGDAAPTRWRGENERVSLPAPTTSYEWPPYLPGDPIMAEVFIPVGLVEDKLTRPADTNLFIVGDVNLAARDLNPVIRSVAPHAYVDNTLWLGEYNFVRSLQATAWAAAAVVLAIGLFSFAISAVDRAVARRQEGVALQLLGTPVRVLRNAQWLEAGLSVGLGLPLAVALGWWCGRGYLVLGGEADAPPTTALASLAALSLLAAVVVSGVTVVAASPRVRPELIRSA
jgi:hypothetical protein